MLWGRDTLEGHRGSWLSALQSVTLARSPSLNLFLLCKMGSWYLAGFVTQLFRKLCGVPGSWRGVAVAWRPLVFCSGSSRMKGYQRHLPRGVITAAPGQEGSLGYSVPPMGTGQLLTSDLWP